MARRTREQIQKEVAERSAQRREEYFKAQAEAKTKAASTMTEVPKPDAYVYTNVWRQGVGTSGGYFSEIKTPNPYYDPSDNTIVNPATGEKTDAGVSMTSANIAFPQGLTSVSGKSVTSVTRNSNGTYTVRYSDGSQTTSDVPPGSPAATVVTDPNAKDPVTGLTQAQKEAADALAKAKAYSAALAAALGAQIDPNTGKIISSTIDPTKAAAWYASQNQNVSNNNTQFTNTGFSTNSSSAASTLAAQQAAAVAAAAAAAEEKRRQGQSAYSLLFSEFERYGLGSLVAPLQQFIVDGLSQAEFTLRLRETNAYKKRFAANAQRINKGLRALSEAEYITLEDQYQNVMRNYGLPASYYARGDMGVQQGFEKFIAGDVSAAELEDRIQTAQNRVINAAPEVATSLREFYPEITGGDILAYALDPDKALTEIRRKVGAAEIGAGARQAGLSTGLARAEELQRYGVSAEQARQGFQAVATVLPRASTLGDIYAKQGMGPFTQTTAEAEIFGTPGAVEAAAKRRKLTELETAQFSGQVGVGALGRERAGQF